MNHHHLPSEDSSSHHSKPEIDTRYGICKYIFVICIQHQYAIAQVLLQFTYYVYAYVFVVAIYVSNVYMKVRQLVEFCFMILYVHEVTVVTMVTYNVVSSLYH